MSRRGRTVGSVLDVPVSWGSATTFIFRAWPKRFSRHQGHVSGLARRDPGRMIVSFPSKYVTIRLSTSPPPSRVRGRGKADLQRLSASFSPSTMKTIECLMKSGGGKGLGTALSDSRPNQPFTVKCLWRKSWEISGPSEKGEVPGLVGVVVGGDYFGLFGREFETRKRSFGFQIQLASRIAS